MRKVVAVFFSIIMLLSVMLPTDFLVVSAEGGQAIFINEIMASNSNTIRDGDVDDPVDGSNGGEYSDWIEIDNSGSQAVNLKGYTLSDSKATWTFPQGSVGANGYLLIWASDKNKVAKDGQLHTNFKLSSSGEKIVLKAPNGSVIDSVTYSSLRDDQSYGRITDGSSQYTVFTKSTPSSSNANGITLVNEPVFSRSGGLYTEAFDLQLTSVDSQAKIYYTTDCSDPVPGAAGTTLYSGSIRIKSRAGEQNVLSMIQNVSTDPQNPWKAPDGEVFKCTTLKAVVVRGDGVKSNIVTNSYFVDPSMKSKYSLPIVSVVTEYNNLFDPTTGIYMGSNCDKTGDEWKKPAHIEYYEKGGTLGFSQNIGISLHGSYTKKYPQKSFNVFADGEYGDLGEIKYEIFPGLTKYGTGKSLKSFDRLILRNAGNDWAFGYMRDEMSQSLVSHIKGLDTQAARPVILFLDGEYWGVYYIRERYDKDYLSSHYNLDGDNTVITDLSMLAGFGGGGFGGFGGAGGDAGESKSDDSTAYNNDVINYLKSNSITQQSTYDYIKTKIDIDNYINYYVAEIFFDNTDWPGNNMSIWRYKTADGKYHPEASYGQDGRWRWLLKDTDFGFGLYSKPATHDTIKYATGEVSEGWANSQDATFLFRTLLQNTEFRNQFINCFADQLNTSFVTDRVTKIISQFENAFSPEVVEHAKRWQYMRLTPPTGGSTTTNPDNPAGGFGGGFGGTTKEDTSTWYENVQNMKDFAKNRPTNMKQFIINKFGSNGVKGTADITLKTDSTKGYIRINTIDINSNTPGVTNPNEWTGNYFTGIPVTVSAIPQSGYLF
ncbi:MAG: CotH kinase family protein, partial [Bacillota bacterium]|nr:CotH kinase family protein [Bacillota bacterium]